MFLSTRYPIPAARGAVAACSGPLRPGEGRDCEACRRMSAAVLLPAGRPGAWLLLLAGACMYVLVQALAHG